MGITFLIPAHGKEYLLERYSFNNYWRWRAMNGESFIQGFKSEAAARFFVQNLKVHCFGCERELEEKELKQATYYDYAKDVELKTSHACPYCGWWNDLADNFIFNENENEQDTLVCTYG